MCENVLPDLWSLSMLTLLLVLELWLVGHSMFRESPDFDGTAPGRNYTHTVTRSIALGNSLPRGKNALECTRGG